MATKDFCSFIKVGDKKYMERLVNHGEVLCRQIQYFKTNHPEDFRGDEFEGAAYVTQVKEFKFFEGDKHIATVNSGQLYSWHDKDQGNIYCLYGISTDILDMTSESTKELHLDMSLLDFGDTAVVIFDPGEFIERFKKHVEANGYVFQANTVNYYNEKEYMGELTPFHKSKKYELQNEIRFWIPNTLDRDLTFNLGDLSDIATLIHKDKISSLGYSPIIE